MGSCTDFFQAHRSGIRLESASRASSKRDDNFSLSSPFTSNPNMSSNESPDALVQLLERYAKDPASSASLVEQLRPFRLALRSTSDLRCAHMTRSPIQAG